MADPDDDDLDLPTLQAPAPATTPRPAPLQRLVVGRPTRVSTDLPWGQAASGAPALSSDGRMVAFVATDPNTAAGGQVYARDVAENRTILVSRSVHGGPADGASYQPDISADGRFIAFTSSATDLVATDLVATDLVPQARDAATSPRVGALQVYLCDLTTLAVTLVSRNAAGRAGEADSFSPSVSADGRFIAFTSLARSFDAADDTVTPDIYRHDRLTGTTTLISVEADGTSAGGISGQPSISAGGQVVAFTTTAALDLHDTNEVSDVYVIDTSRQPAERTRRHRAELVSHTADGWAGAAPSDDPAISADGTAVAFTSQAPDLVGTDTNAADDVFVLHRESDTVELVSRTPDGAAGNDDSHAPSISGDGGRVAFLSETTDLAPLMDGAPRDVDRAFVRDLDGAGTALAASTSRREPGDGSSDGVAVSTWGRHVAFTDSSTDLTSQEVRRDHDQNKPDDQDELSGGAQVYRSPLRTTRLPAPHSDDHT